jgi:hypothetical protein
MFFSLGASIPNSSFILAQHHPAPLRFDLVQLTLDQNLYLSQ